MKLILANLQNDAWTPVVGPAINPVEASGAAVNSSAGLRLYCSGAAYAGILFKHVAPLIAPFTQVALQYSVSLDDSPSGLVLETDTKFTDAAGWTYDGSLQFLLMKAWAVEVGNPWQDCGVNALPSGLKPFSPVPVRINYALDYTARTLGIPSIIVSGVQYTLPPLAQGRPSVKEGWTPNQIVTQLQLCVGAGGGAYSALFGHLAYDLGEVPA